LATEDAWGQASSSFLLPGGSIWERGREGSAREVPAGREAGRVVHVRGIFSFSSLIYSPSCIALRA